MPAERRKIELIDLTEEDAKILLYMHHLPADWKTARNPITIMAEETGITSKILRRKLRSLENYGVVTNYIYSEGVPMLTDYGSNIARLLSKKGYEWYCSQGDTVIV